MRAALESMLEVRDRMDAFECLYDTFAGSETPRNDHCRLRSIKVFLYRSWDERRELFSGTLLDSTDCTTLAALAHMLAHRKGVDTAIARPNQLRRYFHSLLTYERNGQQSIFKIAGSSRTYPCIALSDDEVKSRLQYIKPLVDTVNRLRGI